MAPGKTSRIKVDIEKFRQESGMTVIQLSDESGIARTSLRRKLARPGLCTLDELAILSDILKIPDEAFELAS